MKNKFIRTVAALCVAVMVLMCLCSCSKSGNEVDETTTQVETTKKVVLTDYNRLTGLDDLSDAAKGKRPVAVMVNNIKASLPQYGISKADLMFEVLVEGGITRMMAVYGDYTKVPNVCSVRSCRYYFPIFAYGLDAVYICYGSNPTLGTPTLKRLGIDYFNGAENNDEVIFGRDPNRVGKYKREHTAYELFSRCIWPCSPDSSCCSLACLKNQAELVGQSPDFVRMSDSSVETGTY